VCENRDDLTGSRETYDADAGLFDCLTSSLFAVYQCQNTGYIHSCAAYGFDRSQRGTTGRYDILDYRNTVSFPDRSFEKLSSTVGLGFFSDGESP
jgi:hypothetical protein